MTDGDEPRRRSASAEAAALRWSETHPDDVEPPPAPARRATDDPPRRSASAEAAALRWSEEHPEEVSDEGDR
jgi:hypothetical protein